MSISMHDLEVVLVDTADAIEAHNVVLASDLEAARSTESGIEQLEGDARLLAEANGVSARKTPREVDPAPNRSDPDIPWPALVSAAEKRLNDRGMDTSEVGLDECFSDDEVNRLERRFSGSFTLRTRLDRYDVAGMVLAAVVGALVDVFLVRIPAGGDLLQQQGAKLHSPSPITQKMRDHSLRSENALSGWVKVPYDNPNVDIAGANPKMHRLQTLGHDPLLGLVFGLADLWHGSTTGVDKYGHLQFLPGTGDPNHNPLDIVIRQFGHALSDAFTKMGIPAPGWGAGGLLQVGSLGEEGLTVGETTRRMYAAGYDFRHFLTQSISVAIVDLCLWLYWQLRIRADAEWSDQVDYESGMAGQTGVRNHPRFEALALGSHLIAVAANAGKIQLYGGSPLALNYAEWMRFVHAAYRYSKRWLITPSQLLQRQSAANLDALLDGWPDIDFALPEAPSISVEPPR